MNDKKIIDKKEVYNNFLDRAVNMAKQGKRQNILTPGFYDAVRIGKSFFDLSQEEVYDEIERRLTGEMQELIVPEASEEDVERQKEMNKELETTKKTSKEIQDLQTEADDEDIKRAQDLNKELETTKKHADDLKKAGDEGSLAEKIADKVREKLNKETLEEGKKESTAEIKQRIKDLVQKLKDQNDHLYPEGAKDLAIDMIKKMDIKEALESMGTADEDTMKYLLQDIGREELVNFEKQFVIMFDLLTDIRYDGSEQLSKGASEISQRIHNFITIFRQALKGNPVVKEETIDEGLLDTKELDEMYKMRDALKKVIQITQSFKYYGTDEEQKQADKVYGSNGLQKLVRLLTLDIAKKEGAIDEGKTESLTNNHSNPVTEAAKKRLVSLINSIALKEGISKREATIKAIKSLQESK